MSDPRCVDRIHNRKYGRHNEAGRPGLYEPRMGILLHYDDSSSDRGAVEWFRDPTCQVSYNWLVLDDGTYVEIAPPDCRAWHAGVCRPYDDAHPYEDANSAFYGLAIAARAGETATPAQVETVVWHCVRLFREHGWAADELWRISGHDREAWPRGRKIDPTGPDPKRPVLSTLAIRAEVARRLSAPAT